MTRSSSVTEDQRKQAVDLIRYTSEMFQSVGRDKENSAALQARYLQDLLQHDASEHESRLAVDSSRNGTALGNFAITSPNNAAGTGSSQALLDIADFDAWMSAFEQQTLPSPGVATQDHLQIADRRSDVDCNDNSEPRTESMDWDAVSRTETI